VQEPNLFSWGILLFVFFFSLKDYRLWETRTRAGEKSKEERVIVKNCYVLTMTPHSSCAVQGEKGVGNEGVKLGIGNGRGKVFCYVSFCFSLHETISLERH